MSNEWSVMKGALNLLDRSDRIKYVAAVLIQMLSGFLDLLGVAAFGLVGALAVAAAQEQGVPSSLEVPLSLLGLDDESPARAAVILALGAGVLLLLKSLLVLYLSRRVMFFLARRSASVATDMASRYFTLSQTAIQSKPSQWIAYALGTGVSAAIVGVLSATMAILVEGTLLFMLTVGLLFVDPGATIFSLCYFGLVATLVGKWLGIKATEAGRVVARTNVEGTTTVQDGIATYLEVTVSNRRDFYSMQFSKIRHSGSAAMAEQQYTATAPRYVFDMAMVVGVSIIATILFISRGPEAAAGSLAIYLTAVWRILPSLVKLNSARIGLQSIRGQAELAAELEAFIQSNETVKVQLDRVSSNSSATGQSKGSSGPEQGFQGTQAPHLRLTSASLRYPGSDTYALSDVSFEASPGRSVALVGPSGAGKTSLANIILGLVQPTHGSVSMDGKSPVEMILNMPGLIAYVPQDVALVAGTVRENVALAIRSDEINDEAVWEALRRAHLAEFLILSRDGIDTVIGERGVRLSGGQRQRIGIARALYSNPRLLVMDEATSALDAETEKAITDTVSALSGLVTTVTIAHRLATVRNADLVVYLEDGRCLASGTFDTVRLAVPQFDRQARLLGL